MSMQMVMEAVEGLEKHTMKQLEAVQIKQRELADDMLQLQQRGIAMPMSALNVGGGGKFSKSVIKAIHDNGELISKAQNVRLEIKAAGDALTTSDVRQVENIGAATPTGTVLGVQNAFAQRVIGAVSAVEYSRYLAQEGAAAKQSAEGAAKAAVRPTFSLITQTSVTIAGWTKISKQAMNDSAELAAAIDVTLKRSIATALDGYLTGGTWGGAAGVLAHATAATSTVYTGLADAVSEGVAAMQTAGFQPNVVCMTPDDWLAVVTAKASGSGEYLSGAYLAALPENLRGLRVVLSPTITAGKALLLDAGYFELLTVEDMPIDIGTDADDFTKNMRTILGEVRVIPTFRAVGAARLITPKAA